MTMNEEELLAELDKLTHARERYQRAIADAESASSRDYFQRGLARVEAERQRISDQLNAREEAEWAEAEEREKEERREAEEEEQRRIDEANAYIADPYQFPA